MGLERCIDHRVQDYCVEQHGGFGRQDASSHATETI